MAANDDTAQWGLWKWFQRGTLAIVDQALIAGSNFLVSVLLARWLEPAQYGAFALAYSVFTLFATFHTAIITEPMMVFGAGKYAPRFRKYLAMLLCGHVGLTVPFGVLFFLAALFIGPLYSRDVQAAFLGLAAATPLILLLWLVRRALYVQLQPARAASGAAIYATCLIAAVFLLRAYGVISQSTVFLCMGASALLVSLLFLASLRPRWRGAPNPTPAMVAAEHWRYGRWALGTAALTWVPTNVYYVALPLWVGLEGTAALKALMNLVMPALHSTGALSLLILPVLARQLKDHRARARHTTSRFALLFAAGSLAYYLFLLAFRSRLMDILYKGKYQEFSELILFIGLLPLAISLVAVFGSALRAGERPDAVFWAYAASSALTFLGGLLLASQLGVFGAVCGLLLGSFCTAVVMALFCRRFFSAEAPPAPPPAPA